jgi:glycosyltransferase involved in cell wall biosynthesis
VPLRVRRKLPGPVATTDASRRRRDRPTPTYDTADSVPKLRLGVLATHPIQYHAPLHRAIAETAGIELTVYFAHRPSAIEQGLGFGVPFEWDDELLSGYRHVWLRNRADERRQKTRAAFRDRYSDYDSPELAGIIRAEAYDVFLLHGWRVRSDWQALRACRAARIPTLVRGDSQLRDDPLPKRWGKRIAYFRLMRGFAACLSVGQRSDAYFRYYGARHVVPSPHFVDNDLFARRAGVSAEQRDARRTAWRMSSRTLVLLFAGKLIPRKRPLDLIRAVARLHGVHLLFAGDGPLRHECRTLARRLGVPATFAGFLNQSAMTDAYTAADLLVLPSGRRETWGLVVNEAMACGRPAIVSEAAGCAPDLIREGETGYTYPAGDIAQLRDRITRFLDDAGAAERFGEAARGQVAQFTADAAAAGIVRAARAAVGYATWP